MAMLGSGKQPTMMGHPMKENLENRGWVSAWIRTLACSPVFGLQLWLQDTEEERHKVSMMSTDDRVSKKKRIGGKEKQGWDLMRFSAIPCWNLADKGSIKNEKTKEEKQMGLGASRPISSKKLLRP